MKNNIKIPESTHIIRFQDCDPFGHLNNAQYINYFVNAREDHLLQHYDIDIYKMAKENGISWVTGQNQIAYLRPAFYMKKVIIETQVIHFSEGQIKVEMRMFNEKKNALLSFMWSVFVHFNFNQQTSAKHSPELMEFLNSVHIPIQEKSFEERLKLIRTPS